MGPEPLTATAIDGLGHSTPSGPVDARYSGQVSRVSRHRRILRSAGSRKMDTGPPLVRSSVEVPSHITDAKTATGHHRDHLRFTGAHTPHVKS